MQGTCGTHLGGHAERTFGTGCVGVIRFDHQAFPESNTVTGDKLAWSYTWAHVPFAELDARLKDYLRTAAQEPPYAETWLRVWQELVPQEVTAYLQHQLRIHHFPEIFLGSWLVFSCHTIRDTA